MKENITKYFRRLRGEAGSDTLYCVKAALLKYMHDRGGYFDIEAQLDVLLSDFRLDTIVSLWAGYAVALYDEAAYPLSAEQRASIEKLLFSQEIYLGGQSPELLGEIYQLMLSAEQRKSAGVTYTPEDILEYMTDLLRTDISETDRILDPACGAGFFLLGGYRALMTRCYPSAGDMAIYALHEKLLRENLFGFDISPAACAITKISLALQNKIFCLCPNIFVLDSLSETDEAFCQSFDWVITNPPYVGHKGMEKSYKAMLRERYSEVFYDKADLSYCFFALASRLLKPNGRLLFVTSRYFAQSHFADRLRSMLLSRFSILRIVDYFGVRPFRYIGVDPMIIYARLTPPEKEHTLKAVKLTQRDIKPADILWLKDSSEQLVLQRELSSAGFNFLSDEQKRLVAAVEAKAEHTLGEVFDLFQGVITGCDHAFVVANTEANAEMLAECGVVWIKGKQITDKVESGSTRLLYVPDDIDPEAIPKTLAHLAPYRELLARRRECALGRRNWYALQWARERESFEAPKIVFPYKSAKSRFAFDNSGAFFSADVYAMKPKAEYAGKINLKNAARLMRSPLYEEYFHTYAKKLGGTLYEYYPNTISRLPLPKLSDIAGLSGERAIVRYFGVRIGAK